MGDQQLKIEQWLADIGLRNAEQLAMLQALRALVLTQQPAIGEEIKYGGLLFTLSKPVCGLFCYAEHISLEFSQGAQLDDPHGLLEGAGKYRRHIKLRQLDHPKLPQIADYLAQALGLSDAV